MTLQLLHIIPTPNVRQYTTGTILLRLFNVHLIRLDESLASALKIPPMEMDSVQTFAEANIMKLHLKAQHVYVGV